MLTKITNALGIFSRESSTMISNPIVERFKKETNYGLVVYSKSWCPYSKKAIAILDEAIKKVKLPEDRRKVVEIDLEYPNDEDQIQNFFFKENGSRTVPRIYIGTELIGGCSDLQNLKKSELISKLEAIKTANNAESDESSKL